MSDFFKTRMGQRFYEHTMPELVKQLERLNDNLEMVLRKRQGRPDQERPTRHSQTPSDPRSE